VGTPVVEMVGKRFGRLIVLSMAAKKSSSTHWNCLCDCGGKSTSAGYALRSGVTQSCGCLRKERAAAGVRASKTIHGCTAGGNNKTYRAWVNMITRCQNPRSTQYAWYGARGITVCDRWQKFLPFFEDMGESAPGMTLDRIDSNGNYCPENCRWATMNVQAVNKRNNVWIEIDGEKLTQSQWAKRVGCKDQEISTRRLRDGLSGAEAVYGKQSA